VIEEPNGGEDSPVLLGPTFIPLLTARSQTSTGVSLADAGQTSARRGIGWWSEWLRDGDGGDPQGISVEAFCAERGLLSWLVENLGELRRAEKAGEAPDLERDGLEKWFDFWDVDADGCLSRAELLRGLMKTFRVSALERCRVSVIRRTIEKCFHRWARQDRERISRQEFLSPNGLGVLLLGAVFPSHQENDDSITIIPSPPTSPRVPVPQQPERHGSLFRSESWYLEQKLSALRKMSQSHGPYWRGVTEVSRTVHQKIEVAQI
jgi:hypothetical protein